MLPGALLKKRQVCAEGSLGNGNLGVRRRNKGRVKALVTVGREEMKVWQSSSVETGEDGSCVRLPGLLRGYILKSL